MSLAQFVHLHNHSQYSLLDGACRIDDMLAEAVKMKMPALALTDHGNLFGAIEFYTKARKLKIKPIIGIEAYVAPESRFDRSPKGMTKSGYHLIILAKNLMGYRNLMKLSTLGYLEGFYNKPRIDKELLREYGDGLIALSACLKGEIALNILSDRYEEAKTAAKEYLDILGPENFYLEIQNHGLPEEAKVAAAIKEIADNLGVGLVATNDCHYMKREHYDAHDALLCIQTGKVLEDTNRMKYITDQIYFKSPEEMVERFADTPEAIENTLRIAEDCSLELDLFKIRLPDFPLPEAFKTTESYLNYLTLQGLERRYGKVTTTLEERVRYELDIINSMGYAGYFLIVKDFVDYARANNIRVGPGRGSAAGSIVSYCLGITNLDPIKYGLLFERFLNPERISMPDIDIDFADRGRDKVIDYVTNKYGKESVAQIITFGSMAARAVVRDVGRVMSLSYGDVDVIAKLIPMEIDMTLEKALKVEQELGRRYEEEETIKTLIDRSRILEGLARHASTHAAGVVIAPGPITEYAPLYKSNKDEITTQYDMRWIEAIGLIKMDFLGLRTLTVIDDCLKLLKKRGINLDIDKIPLDDVKVYELFSKGETVGIFQFESGGMREYLKKLRPNCLEDLTAMNALYRPGPLDAKMIDVYIGRKKGLKDIEYAHPLLESILKVTYGVIVFQEQVLKIARELAGYSLGEADILRKAIGKKQADIMAEQKDKFIKGAEERKVDKNTAVKIFEQIETFGRYGFVKAHSACYAYIAYQTAYLKVHYPVEFMAALMTSEMSDTSRIMEFKAECERMKIELAKPDINSGEPGFSVDGKSILFGLAAIKNVGWNAVESIVKTREDDGEFTDIFDFCSRVDHRLVNRRTVENLVMAGAMDKIGLDRAVLFESIETAINYGAKIQREKETRQSTLFGDKADVMEAKPKYPDSRPWSKMELLAREKDSLGYWLSGHPLDPVKELFEAYVDMPLVDLERASEGKKVIVGGVLTQVKIQTSRRGNQFALLNIEDFSGSGEVIIFSDIVEKRRMLLIEGNIVVVFGTTSTREGENTKIRGDDMTLLESAPREFPLSLSIRLEEGLSEGLSEKLKKEFENSAGKGDVVFHYRQNGRHVTFRSKKYKVDPSAKLIERLKDLVGPENVSLTRS
ncbi:MAG: DNA polymerase III subunit alpha [Candidatus Zixiibacteriota bacterium]|nr:MAG: DNA polymerase III subunit alpha [candidate division Zixibacteria bacterium]